MLLKAKLRSWKRTLTIIMTLTIRSFRRYWRFIRRHLPPLNFITFHFLYFVATCCLGAIVLWSSATPKRSLTFTDSVFLAVSAMSEAGLNTVNLSTLNTFQQVVLFFLIMSGSGVLVSAVVVQVRKAAFEQEFQVVMQGRRESRLNSMQTPFRTHAASIAGFEGDANERDLWLTSTVTSTGPRTDDKTVQWGHSGVSPLWRGLSGAQGQRSDTRAQGTPSYNVHPGEQGRRATSEEGMLPRAPQPSHHPGSHRLRTPGSSTLPSSDFDSATPAEPGNGQLPGIDSHESKRRGSLSFSDWFVRSSKSGLNSRERERLGGSEYRAVCLLAWIVPLYYVLWQLLGALGCAAWVAHHRPDIALQNGLNPWWVGAFKAVSAFNNSGMDLLDKNMQPFQDAYYLLITMSLLILAGNTCYPVFLRLIIWSMLKLAEPFELRSEEWGERVATLKFLLKHPRRCYTLLFPAKHTWWLISSVFILNGIDWAAFGILSVDNPALADIPAGEKVIDGLFQAFAIRSGGFSVVPISSLHIALQLLYVLMMYISVYPLLMSLRTSNVYEERSVGIYEGEDEPVGECSSESTSPGERAEEQEPRSLLSRLVDRSRTRSKEANENLVSQRLRSQLAHDVWWMAFALFCILLIEERQFSHDPGVFSVFNFIFEIVSAYGTVGVSTGVPWQNYSFCGSWHKGSKIILCAVMLRGRHRGLPVAIDKAVLLPGEEDDETGTDGLAHVGWNLNGER